jgi:hypothetical protein
MIAIHHVSGPLAGTTRSFEEDKDRIEFGRDPDQCDVVYPVDDVRVGRRHFALRREPSGDWAVDVYGEHFVSLDGLPAEADQPALSGSTFRLGRADGPGFTVTFDRADLPGLRTSDQEAPAPVRVAMHRLAIAGGVIAIGLAAAIGFWVTKEQAEREADRKHVAATYASLVEKQEKLSDQQARVVSDRIDPKAIDRLRRATYLVFLQDKEGRQAAQGTAWVIGTDLLATNSHVAEIRDELKPGEKLFVRQPGQKGATLEVTEHVKHPGYTAFPLYIKDKDTTYLSRFQSGIPRGIDAGLGYDVALLRVKGKLPKELILKIAPKEELLALEPGLPLASAGYPSEYILGASVLPLGATPQVHFGNVTALTDYFHLPTDMEHSLLVHHSIPGTGGASGSAIVGPSGRVVAVVNAANFLGAGDGGRIPNAAAVNYGQRADLVTDLLEKKAESALEADKAYWDRQMANFKRGVDAFGAWVLDKQQPDPKAAAQSVFEKSDRLEAADMQIRSDGKNRRVKVLKLDLAAGKTYTIFVYAENQTAIKLYLVDGGDQKVAESSGDYWYPSFKFQPPADGSWPLYVDGPDMDTTFTIKLYAWQSPAS